MASWPAQLPQDILLDSYSEQEQQNVLRTSDSLYGDPQVRRRSAPGPFSFQCLMELSNTQIDILETFYNTTLSGGILKFDWKHPRTEEVRKCRFISSPVISGRNNAGIYWDVSLNIEVFPY